MGKFFKNIVIISVAVFFISNKVSAEKYDFSLETPYDAVVSHLAYLDESQYYPMLAAQVLGGGGYTVDQKVGLAIKLKRVLNVSKVELGKSSKKKLYINKSFQNRYDLCPNEPAIYLTREGGEWKYSPETVDSIAVIYNRLFPEIAPFVAEKDTLQKLEEDFKFSLVSPYNTIRSFLLCMSKENYHPEIAKKTIFSPLLSEQEKIGVVEKLVQLFPGLGITISLDKVSKNRDYLDPVTKDSRFILSSEYPELYLIKEDSNWVFSELSCQFVLKKHKEIYFLGTNLLESLAKKVQAVAKGQSVEEIDDLGLGETIQKWEKVTIGLLLSLFIACYLFFVFLLKLFLKLFYREEKVFNKASRIVPPFVSFCILVSINSLLPSLGQNANSLRYIINITNIISITLLIVVLFRLIDFVSEEIQKKQSIQKDGYKKGLTPFFGMFAKVIVLTVSVMYILQQVGIDLKTFLTGLSIGGLTLALAAQDSLKNFFGSVMIFLDRPFQIGDWIVSDTVSGDVESIGLRSTRIRTFHNSLITVPNSKLADFTLDNMGKRKFRRFKTFIKLKYDTSPESIQLFTDSLQKMVVEHELTNSDKFHIYLNDYGKYSLDIMFYIFFDVPDWGGELKARHDVMIKTIAIARELNIEFADPLSSQFFSESK